MNTFCIVILWFVNIVRILSRLLAHDETSKENNHDRQGEASSAHPHPHIEPSIEPFGTDPLLEVEQLHPDKVATSIQANGSRIALVERLYFFVLYQIMF